MLLVVGCDDFYSDSPPTPAIAQPTPANVQEGDPLQLVEVAARAAMAASLGISPESPRKILLEDETWTDQSPGCYPTPTGITGPYLVPGYRLLMQHEGVFYEFHADLGGSTGALCDSTLQLVPVEPALGIVNPADSALPNLQTVHILRSEEDVTEFNSINSNTATIAVDQVDWDVEVLVGGWVEIESNAEVVKAYQSPEGTVILIEVATPEELPEEQTEPIGPGPTQIWALIDITVPDSTYEFITLE